MYITDLLGHKVKRQVELPPPSPRGSVTSRKVALIGSAMSLELAPWYDPSWEIWAHATCHNLCVRVDRYFDLHPWEWIVGKNVKGYLEFLRSATVPVYLQQKQKEVPASRAYPKDRILSEFRGYFTNHMAWMSALALTEGVSTIGLFGIHYEHDAEHKAQRGCCEYWVGYLEGRGVKVVIPERNPVCKEPGWLYGYESHDGKIHKRAVTGVSPTHVKPQTPLLEGEGTPRTDLQALVGHDNDFIFDPAIREAFMAGTVPVIAGKPAW